MERLRIEENKFRRSDLDYTNWVAIKETSTGDEVIKESPTRYSPQRNHYVKQRLEARFPKLTFVVSLFLDLILDTHATRSTASSDPAEEKLFEDELARYQRMKSFDLQDLVDSLVADGWTPVEKDDKGNVVTMEKQLAD